jgi:hypothetical protein
MPRTAKKAKRTKAAARQSNASKQKNDVARGDSPATAEISYQHLNAYQIAGINRQRQLFLPSDDN